MKKTTGTTKMLGKSGSNEGRTGDSPSQLIDARIKELGDWRGETLARIRRLIKQADPEVIEEWKWRGVPVWSHAGMICSGETYKNVVKVTFAKGASLADPSGLFNSSLDGNTRRAIDLHEGDKIDEEALKALIRAGVALNTSSRAGAVTVRRPGVRSMGEGRARGPTRGTADRGRPQEGFPEGRREAGPAAASGSPTAPAGDNAPSDQRKARRPRRGSPR